ncbi:o-succinylbenzoate synthase [Pullulanibacillus sp. KACC 23026]|uniref:o-succinylbenzoate synthase n=1 Tax=Pullulanibacillus sp. KACC 23026 TaxID=3028315 RepID=UPI0023AEED84|nr:o-succinylbenzoate synthase [Pullulanibacillus sp. KACC 23026]WEG12967.1 o-succinylbenzoate synthase [Pullulanibacillus sp. KACC 23026]
MLQLETITLTKLKMRLKSPFTTSYGTMQDKVFFLIEITEASGLSGFGESVAFTAPWYTEETVDTSLHMMKDFLIPLLLEAPIEHPDEVFERFRIIRRNNMAKAALEGAVWDLYAKKQGISLTEALGGVKSAIDVGISIGIQENLDKLFEVIEDNVKKGYRRIKIKIKPGMDLSLVKAVRETFPSLPLMVDANSAYSLEDLPVLKQLDPYDLLMIEQPLSHDDILDHVQLQKEIQTPICLDESINSFDDARHAIDYGAAKVINIKIGKVGGLSEAKRIHDYCFERGVPVWCGGMLEAGVGRAHNIALTTLPGFTLPGDTAASSNYWEHDIIQPEVTVVNGQIQVPIKPGIGYEIDREAVRGFTIEDYSVTRRK